MRIHEIRGMRTTTAERLAAEGVTTSEALLEAGKTVAGRKSRDQSRGRSESCA